MCDLKRKEKKNCRTPALSLLCRRRCGLTHCCLLFVAETWSGRNGLLLVLCRHVPPLGTLPLGLLIMIDLLFLRCRRCGLTRCCCLWTHRRPLVSPCAASGINATGLLAMVDSCSRSLVAGTSHRRLHGRQPHGGHMVGPSCRSS